MALCVLLETYSLENRAKRDSLKGLGKYDVVALPKNCLAL